MSYIRKYFKRTPVYVVEDHDEVGIFERFVLAFVTPRTLPCIAMRTASLDVAALVAHTARAPII